MFKQSQCRNKVLKVKVLHTEYIYIYNHRIACKIVSKILTMQNNSFQSAILYNTVCGDLFNLLVLCIVLTYLEYKNASCLISSSYVQNSVVTEAFR